MASSPRCPMCGDEFSIPSIREGYVRCPKCETPMFQYRMAGDDALTPRAFMGLLHPRANDAIVNCKHWFPGSPMLQSARAAAFVFRLWPVLAEVFQKEPTHG